MNTSIPGWTRPEFERRVRPLRPALVRKAIALIGPNDAEDLVQDGLLRAWTMIERFHPEDDQARLLCWLSQILSRIADEYARSYARRPTISLSPQALLLLSSDDCQPALTSDERAELWKLIQQRIHTVPLEPLSRQCLDLFIVGYTHQEIADRLSMDRRAVTGRLIRACARLQEEDVPEAFLSLFRYLSRVTIYTPPKGVWAHQAR